MTTTDTVATVHVGRHRIVFSTNGLRAIHVLVERTAPLLPAYGGAQAMIALTAAE